MRILVGIFKPAEPHSPWDACYYTTINAVAAYLPADSRHLCCSCMSQTECKQNSWSVNVYRSSLICFGLQQALWWTEAWTNWVEAKTTHIVINRVYYFNAKDWHHITYCNSTVQKRMRSQRWRFSTTAICNKNNYKSTAAKIPQAHVYNISMQWRQSSTA